VRNCADFFTNCLNHGFAIGEGIDGLSKSFDVFSRGGQIHSEGYHSLPYAVVQFAGDPSSLIILRFEQTGTEFAQTLIGTIEFRCALSDFFLQFPLRQPQLFIITATFLSHCHHDT